MNYKSDIVRAFYLLHKMVTLKRLRSFVFLKDYTQMLPLLQMALNHIVGLGLRKIGSIK